MKSILLWHPHTRCKSLVVVVIAQQLFSYRQVVQVEEVCDCSRVVPQVLHCKLHRMAFTVHSVVPLHTADRYLICRL